MISTWNNGWCYFGKHPKSACRQRKVLDVRSCSNLLRQGKCLAGTDSRTSSECLARAVAASCARENVRRYSPPHHALGRAPDLDGRFYTPAYESYPAIQAELVDETYGNNIKRVQDSQVNFLRWTYQNRVSRALNSKDRKAHVFLPGTYVYYWHKDERETKNHSRALLELSAQKSGEKMNKKDPQDNFP